MKSTIKRRTVIVGIFLFFAMAILVAGILSIGNIKSSFAKKFAVTTIFDEVGGLQEGNNVWYSGLKIGTVKSLHFFGKSQVEARLMLDVKAKPFIRSDARTKIGSDGLIGNKIVIIFGGTDGAPDVQDGDTLIFEKGLSTEEMMNTLQQNNQNILAITNDFKAISSKIRDGEGSLGKLLADETLYNQVLQTVEMLNSASSHANRLTASLAEFGTKMNREGSLTNDLVTDTTLFRTIGTAVAELQRIAVVAAELTVNLKNATGGLNDPKSPAGVLLHDQETADRLKSTIKNLETSTEKLNEDLEALQHNFLFRGYFRKKGDQ